MIDLIDLNSNRFIWFIFDLKRKMFEEVSPSLQRVTGYDINRLNGIINKDKADTFSEDINLIIDFINQTEGNSTIELPYPVRILTKDKETRWIELSLQIRVNENGTPFKLYGMGWDVTSYLNHNEKLVSDLKKQKEELSLIVYFNREILKIKEEERRKIALEIHDELGQLLSALKLEQTMLIQRVRTPSTKQALQSMLTMTSDCINTVRRLSTELHPSIIDHLGLFPAIEWLGNNFSKRTKVNLNMILPENDKVEFSSTQKIFIFRVVQEALNNIMKHANAKSATVSISLAKGKLKLRITDDGMGFDTKQKKEKHSLGLLGIQERINAMGGQLEIASEPHKGTTINCSIPIKFK